MRRLRIRILLLWMGGLVVVGIGLLAFGGNRIRDGWEQLRGMAGWGVSDPVVARVAGTAITRSEVDRLARMRLWIEGTIPEGMAAERRRNVVAAALEELIDERLIDLAAAGRPLVSKDDSELRQRLEQLRAKFESEEAWYRAIRAQGFDGEGGVAEFLAKRVRRERYINAQIAAETAVTDDELRSWWEAHAAELAIPERVEVRHVFIATLETASDVARAKLAAAMVELRTGRKDFGTLVRELSEDVASKDRGGNLGWMTLGRVPADFGTAVMALPLHEPALRQTRLGWHLLEVTGRQPAVARNFEQAKPEVLAALETIKRRNAVASFRNTLRKRFAEHIVMVSVM